MSTLRIVYVHGIRGKPPEPEYHVELAAATGVKAPPKNLRTNQPMDGGGGGRTVVAAQKVGRNDPCPCGSGRKYKKCHGAE